MTKTGYSSLQAMAPSYDLKQQLVAGEWCFYGHGSEQIVTVDLPWEGHLDPFSLVNFNKPCWKFFWRSKESSQVIVGFGSVLQLGQEILSDSPHLKGLRFFGGLAFPGTPAETWDGFTDGYFVLPEVEWSFTGNEHGSIQLRLLSPADEDRDKLIQRFSDLYRSYVTATLSGTETELGRVVKQSHLPDHDGWVKMVKDAIQSIKSGNHQKVVLSRVQDMILENDIDVGLLLKRLSKLQESSYLFSFTTPEGKTFLGRSPERLLSWQNRTVYVEAIAGTRKRSQGESEDFASACELTNSKKDLVEHRFVSDFVEQTLSQFCTSVEQVEKEQLLRLKNVQHMRSIFKAVTPEGMMPLSLLRALHPTPAVGGCPREPAMDFIQELEPFSRGLFAGAVGYSDGYSGDFAIGIRTALISGHSIRLFAGAGIVEKSDPEAEWLETEIKMKNFLDILTIENEDYDNGIQPQH